MMASPSGVTDQAQSNASDADDELGQAIAEIVDCLDESRWDDACLRATEFLAREACAHAILNLRGVAHIALNQFIEAEADTSAALQADESNVRYRQNWAVSLVGLGRYQEAREQLESMLAANADNVIARYHLARVDVIEFKYEAALNHLLRVNIADPNQPEVLKLMAVCFREGGLLPEAVGVCEQALLDNPTEPWFRNCIAICLIRMGHFHEATRRVAQIIESLPPEKDMLFQLGLECQEQGSPHLAVDYFKKFYALFPNDIDACVNLGICLQMFGALGEALFYFTRAFELQPTCAEALSRAGTIYEFVKDKAKATALYEAALEADPKHVDTLARLASRRKDAGNIEEAKEMLRKAIDLNAESAYVYLNLIAFLNEQQNYEESEQVLIDAKKRWPHMQEIRHAGADLLLKRADIAGAMQVYREILAEHPRNPGAMSGMLFCMNYDPELSAQALADAYKDWDTRFNAPFHNRKITFRNDPDPERKLRVGYVSGDFRGHSVGFFAEPILESHNHDEFEIYCYANQAYADKMTHKFGIFADKWRWILDLSDEALVEMIRLDEIDILIDLSNHTAFHRLHMFARRAAPIQMTWIGMPTTTGLAAIDYRITDERMDPPGLTESLHSEKLLRIVSGWCYRPAEEARDSEILPLPALQNGHLTFASFNAFGKINTGVIRLWARIFNALPGAILHMATGGKNDDEVLNEEVRKVFAQCGFPLEQLKLFGRKELVDYFAFHNEIDIALDPFPYNGGTVTAHAIWMGVPVLSLAGVKPIQRMGATMMGVIGRGDFVANSEDEYVEIAIRYANDIEGLAEIRRTMRQTMKDSPLMDAKLVTGDLERAFKEVWAEWCAQQEIED